MNDTVAPTRLSERAQNPRVLRLHPDDNVIVSIDPILPGAVAETLERSEPATGGAHG